MQIKPVVGRLAYLLPDKSNRLVLQARLGAHLPQAHGRPKNEDSLAVEQVTIRS